MTFEAMETWHIIDRGYRKDEVKLQRSLRHKNLFSTSKGDYERTTSVEEETQTRMRHDKRKKSILGDSEREEVHYKGEVSRHWVVAESKYIPVDDEGRKHERQTWKMNQK